MARFYSNENFPLPVVLELRAAGHDVLTSLEAGRANQKIPDDQVLAFATLENRILLTLNRRHFVRLHNLGAVHAGIVACTVDADYSAQAARIHHEVAHLNTLANHLLRISRLG
jgi:hypothetical protein